MISIRNGIYKGSKNRSSLFDLEIPETFSGNLLVFIHGYMGFKDWGAWNLMQNYFTSKGFGFCKFNMTHNGGTIDNPIDFPDLEAFASNCYSKEVNDVTCLLNELETHFNTLPKIHLLGHSRGGGIALLKSNDQRVSSIITLAGISSIETRFSDSKMIQAWKETGIRYQTNQRTKQEMPHYYSQYLDFVEFKNELNIEKACLSLTKPNLVIHGTKDSSVLINEGEDIAQWTNSPLYKIEGADHVFCSSHPWNKNDLPRELEEVCFIISSFIIKQSSSPDVMQDLELMHELISFSKVDGEMKEIEFVFILQIAKQLGLTKQDLLALFEQKMITNPPKAESDRILQFYRLCLLMLIDLEVHPMELETIRNAGIRLGLNPNATEELLRLLMENPSKGIPTPTLLSLFQVNFN
jgi:pimeloyl-ACP methyl ester carboxylesterase